MNSHSHIDGNRISVIEIWNLACENIGLTLKNAVNPCLFPYKFELCCISVLLDRSVLKRTLPAI